MLAHVDNRITYNGNGNATEFAYQFKILDRTDIKVLLTDADGKEKLLTKDYYVDVEKSVVRYPGYAVGAEVPEGERPPVLPTGWKLTIYREVPVTQETDLPDQYPFNQVEDIGDKLTMIAQQLTDVTSRSLKISVSKSADIDTTIPWENGKSFRISDDGKTFELTEDPAKVLPLAQGVYAQTQAQAQSAYASAVAAAQSEDSAAASASEAGNSAQYASVSAASAAEDAELTSGYKQEALTAKANATASATNAKASEANAKTSENNAEASKEAAQSAASNANNFATSASSSASEAKSYRDAANNYAANAKNYSENVNVFLPSVSDSGVLSWTNKAGLANPASVNIKGAKGDKGDTGAAATIKVGTVTTGAAGSNASVVNRGDANNAILDFVLPKGTDGKGSVITVNGKEPDAGGNVNVANMAGASDSAAGKAGLAPIPAAGKQDMALCGDATFKVLPVEGGGTGLTSNPSMLINLASAVASNVFQTSPSPGVTGVLSIANGGTGANTISAACKALGLDWDWFHRYGLNYVPPDVTNNGWNSLGLCLIYYTEVKIKNQPSTYGQLLNIPANQYFESTQIWIEQDSGALYFRGGNGSNIVNDKVFTRVATEADVSSAGYGIIAANLAQNGYVKFANGLILQWGYYEAGQTTYTLTFPISFRQRALSMCLSNSNNGKGKAVILELGKESASISNDTWENYWIAVGV